MYIDGNVEVLLQKRPCLILNASSATKVHYVERRLRSACRQIYQLETARLGNFEQLCLLLYMQIEITGKSKIK